MYLINRLFKVDVMWYLLQDKRILFTTKSTGYQLKLNIIKGKWKIDPLSILSGVLL